MESFILEIKTKISLTINSIMNFIKIVLFIRFYAGFFMVNSTYFVKGYNNNPVPKYRHSDVSELCQLCCAVNFIS